MFVEIPKDNLSYLSYVLFEFVQCFRSNPSSRGSRIIDKMAIMTTMTTESMAYFKTISFLENVDAKCRVFLIRHLDE